MKKPTKEKLVFRYETIAEDEGIRLDVLLARQPEIASRSFAQNLIKNGNVCVDGKKSGKNQRLAINQIVEYKIPAPKECVLEAQDIPIDIIYEDKHLAIVNKQAGLVVHPSYGHWEKTLVNALLYHLKNLSSIGGVIRPGIVHRLDKNTSGLMLIAKDDKTHIALSEAIKKRKVKREYKALVCGSFKENKFIVEAPIGRHPLERKKMSVQSKGRFAKTNAKVLKRYKSYTLLKLSLTTGKTHQIRVHLSYINHPVVGDDVYGRDNLKGAFGLKRLFLHAFKLGFTHPQSGKKMQFEVELPEDLERILADLKEIR